MVEMYCRVRQYGTDRNCAPRPHCSCHPPPDAGQEFRALFRWSVADLYFGDRELHRAQELLLCRIPKISVWTEQKLVLGLNCARGTRSSALTAATMRMGQPGLLGQARADPGERCGIPEFTRIACVIKKDNADQRPEESEHYLEKEASRRRMRGVTVSQDENLNVTGIGTQA